MVVALLVFAMAGGAYAAIQLPANSVGTTQLENGAVTATKVKVRRASLGCRPRGEPDQVDAASGNGSFQAVNIQLTAIKVATLN